MQQQALEGSRSRFLDQICADLLRCRKIIKIYPQEHPRVRESLDEMRRSITERVERTGDAVSMETLLIEDLANRENEDEQIAANYGAIARLLKLHLIQEVRFQKDISNDELYEFASLLQEDFFEAPADRLDRIDPCSWTSIELWFYTPQDFPDDLAAGETLLGRAAGLSRSEAVQGLLKDVPRALAARIRQALVKPTFLRKISELRRKLQERAGDADGEETQDLMAAVVKKILDGVGSAESTSVEDILMTVDNYIHAVEMRIARADAGIDPASGSPPSEFDEEFDLVLPMLNSIKDESATERATDLQKAFGVSPSADVTRRLPAEEESEDSEPAAPPVRKQVRKAPKKAPADEASLDHLFEGVEYDLDAWREALGRDDQSLRYLRVLLELLLDRSCQLAMSKNWPAVLESLTAEINDRSFMKKVITEVTEFSTVVNVVPVGELLSLLLEAIDSTAVIHAVLEDHVIPTSEELAIGTLERLVARRPKRILEVLMRLHQHSSATIHVHAETALISLSKNSSMLEAWAREYPGGLVDPRVFSRIVERESPERLIDTFKDFFTHTPPENSLRLLRLITPDLAGVDCILIAAIQSGPHEVHDCALEFLDQSCIPVVTGTLIQTVRLNNYQQHLSMKEVETALDALCQIDEPRAREFIHDVETSRSGWLRYEYRREIRDALKKIRERQGQN